VRLASVVLSTPDSAPTAAGNTAKSQRRRVPDNTGGDHDCRAHVFSRPWPEPRRLERTGSGVVATRFRLPCVAVCAGASWLLHVQAMTGLCTCFPAHNRSLAVGVDGVWLVLPHVYLLCVAVRARASRFRHV